MIVRPQVLVAGGGIEPENAGMITIEVIDDLRAVDAVWEAWHDLLKRSAANRAFGSPIWYRSACQAYPDHRPYLVLAKKNESIRGIFPLVIDPKDQTARFAAPFYTDYNDLILEPGADAIGWKLIKFALDPERPYHKLELIDVRMHSHLNHGLYTFMGTERLRSCLKPMRKCYYLPLDREDYKTWLGEQSRSFRKALRRRLNKLDLLQGRIIELRPENFDAGQLLETFLSLHLSRLGKESSFLIDHNPQFIQHLLPDLFKEGYVKVLAIQIKGKILAIQLFMFDDKCLCPWSGGFSKEIAALSPGSLLFNTAIREAYDRHWKELDWLRGDYPYKSEWSDHYRMNYRFDYTLSKH